MSRLTDLRAALIAALSDLPGDVKAAAAPSDYGDASQQFYVRVIAGVPGEATEALLDEMLEPAGERSVKEALETDSDLDATYGGAYVAKHSGYMNYDTPEGKLLGAQWTVVVAAP